MKSKNVNQSKGFTIIETLIVLAIAATIFLVVFLAVSALDRSSRNTARKEDAANVLAAVGDYVSDNNGALPPVGSTVTGAGQSWTLNGNGGGATGNVSVGLKMSHYVGGNITFVNPPVSNVALGQNDVVEVVNNATCGTSSSAAAGSTGSYAVVYTIESGSNFVQQCIGS
jgi:prepilin-type N-terminal cleavage/methylation domain-containing protein